MSRSIDPILEAALANQQGEVIIRVLTWADADAYNAAPTVPEYTWVCKDFDLYNTQSKATLITANDYTVSDFTVFIIERGVKLDGVEYTIQSGLMHVRNYKESYGEILLEGSSFPNIKVSIAGDETYENVITAFCTAIGKTAIFKNADAPWLGYKFLPYGKTLSLNRAELFENFIRQKYCILVYEESPNNLIFYNLDDGSSEADFALSYQDGPACYIDRRKSEVHFFWRDENAEMHTSGDELLPQWHLGYLESTDDPPATRADAFYKIYLLKAPIRLDITDSDKVHFTPYWSVDPGQTIDAMMQISEHLHLSKSPTWYQEITSIAMFTSTEGGALPSTIERVAAYTPLVSTSFDGNLTPSVNNLQALAEAVDDLYLYFPPATTAANDIQVGDGAGNWIKKTIAQFVSLLRSSLDSVYASLSSGVTNGNSHDHSGGDGAQIPTGGIVDGAVTNAKLVCAYNTVKGRIVDEGTGPAQDISFSDLRHQLFLDHDDILMSANNNLTLDPGLWQSTNLSLWLNAGTHLVIATVRGALRGNAGSGWWLTTRLWNITELTAIPYSERMIVYTNTNTQNSQACVTLVCFVTVTAFREIIVQASRNGVGTPLTFYQSAITTGTTGYSNIVSIRIGN
jgi:hypothetical protein